MPALDNRSPSVSKSKHGGTFSVTPSLDVTVTYEPSIESHPHALNSPVCW
jgi:hypothetical protein